LMVNAVEHGNLGISYDEKSKLLDEGEWHNEIARRLTLPQHQEKFAILDYTAHADSITFTIRDQGMGFDWQLYIKFVPARWFDPNGRGIAIAVALDAWDIQYHDNGRRVVCRVPA
jgi:Histidine kinase-like ATPase domain